MTLISYDTLKNLANIYLIFAFFYVTINTKYIYILHYHCDNLFSKMNEILHNGVMYCKEHKEENILEEKVEENKEIIKPEEKYEDKYLEKMRQMSKEFNFSEEELKIYDEMFPKMFKEEMEKPDTEINDIENIITVYKKDINDLLEQDFVIENDDSEFDSDEYKMILIKDKQDKITLLEKEREELKKIKSNITEDEIRNIVNDRIKNLQINKHLERLNNCYIMEKTPLGNIIMIYNNEREIFQYYSDATIPYRYLEPVGRKYVITFDCRPIFVDMEEELKIAEEKIKEKEEQEKMKLEEIKNAENNKENKLESVQKKNVFAKFKSYNKEAGAGKSMVPPPKNSITNRVVTNSDDKNEKILLKERSNRYSHEGRFSNFNILKKVDKKVVCKKYGMSFAEFKKMQQAQSNLQT